MTCPNFNNGDALFNTAALLVKGAACVALVRPMANLVISYERVSAGKGKMRVQMGNSDTVRDPEKIKKNMTESIRMRLSESDTLRCMSISREAAEKVYKKSIYNVGGIPATVTDLVIVVAPEFAMDCHLYPAFTSTEAIESLSIDNIVLKESSGYYEVHFSAVAVASPRVLNGVAVNSAVALEVCTEASAFPLALCLPPSGAETAFEVEETGVTPFDVGTDSNIIDYDKLINKFGSQRLTSHHVERIEKLTGKKPHHFLTRGIFFSHRDIDLLLDSFEQGKEFYLYTGRGPSSEALHLGHLVPFLFTQYLQEAFGVKLVVQLTDDEKFLFKEELEVEQVHKMGFENSRDIIACGFDRSKTFIFSDLDYIGYMYPTILKIQKKTTYNQSRAIFGFEGKDNIGKAAFPAVQAAPSFSDAFPHMFAKGANVHCLIPHAIDQDPYFRMTRDVSYRIGCKKPALIHSKFFPGLQGFKTKMSSSASLTSIFMTDSPDDIKQKIMKHAFTGGGATLEEHRQNGANVEVDIPFQYLVFFLTDDEKLEDIRHKYSTGLMTTGEVKEICVQVLCDVVSKHQAAREAITDDEIRHFMSIRKM